MRDLPVDLGRVPLVEMVVEVRFNGDDVEAAHVLPGLLIGGLRLGKPRIEALPLASLPAEFRKKSPNLRYSMLHRIHSPETTLLVGDNTLAIVRFAPYDGWAAMRERIESVFAVLADSDLVHSGALERMGLKAVNIIPSTKKRSLDMLDLRVELSGSPVPDQGFKLRSERNDERLVRILEISPDTTWNVEGRDPVKGLGVSVDCIRGLSAAEDWNSLADVAEELHHEQKSAFFSLLTDETLISLEPTYAKS